MSIATAVRARLVSLAPVTALVGQRVYVSKLPQAPTYPCVRVSLVEALQDQHCRGLDDLEQARVQIDCYAQEASGVDTEGVATAVEAATFGDGNGSTATGLAGWIGSVSGLSIVAVWPRARVVGYDPQELRVLTVTRDYTIWSRAEA